MAVLLDREPAIKARLPNFVIIGAQKAGTTWMAARLREQPGLFLPPRELHYFDRNQNHSQGVAWYSAHFQSATGLCLGEKTPDYFWTTRPNGHGPNDIPERMYQLLPHARLIVVLRDPVRRAISALNHLVRARWVSPFVDPDKVIARAMDPAADRAGIISRGLYVNHLERFLEFYPKDQIHIVFFEDEVARQPQQTIDNVMRFLGCTSQPIHQRRRPENSRMNSRLGLILNYYTPRLTKLISAVDLILPEASAIQPSPRCLSGLYDYFSPHNEALFRMLGRRTDAWKPGVTKGEEGASI